MQPGKVLLIEINSVVILNSAILDKPCFVFNAHSVFRYHPFDIIVFGTNVGCDIIHPLRIDFPSAIGIDPSVWHFIEIIEALRRYHRCRVHRGFLRFDTDRLIIIHSEKIHGIFLYDCKLVFLIVRQKRMLLQELHQLLRIYSKNSGVKKASSRKQLCNAGCLDILLCLTAWIIRGQV